MPPADACTSADEPCNTLVGILLRVHRKRRKAVTAKIVQAPLLVHAAIVCIRHAPASACT